MSRIAARIGSIFAAIVAFEAMAGVPVLKSDSAMLRLLPEPCTERAVLKLLKPEAHKLFHRGSLIYNGRNVLVCWTFDGTAVQVVHEDGESVNVPVALLHMDAGI